MLLEITAAVPVVIWTYLLLGRGGFWHVRSGPLTKSSAGAPLRQVVAVIPARNEADVIARAITSLLGQQFPTPLQIVVVDDNSNDATSAVVRDTATRLSAAERVRIVSGRPLEAGWTGKLWALSQGVARARDLNPDYLLFTDGDIEHGPEVVAQLVSVAERKRLDLASYMVRLTCETTAEKALIPAFVFFFLMLYPPAWIRSPRMRTAGAAGGCILIRPEALERIGGLPAIRGNVIDDCALARAVKQSGGRIWMGLTTQAQSIRPYGSWREIGEMISRTAFNQLHHSAVLLLGTVAGLFLTYLLPVVFVISGHGYSLAFGAAAWLMMSAAYLPMVRFYRRRWLWSLALPGIAVFYAVATVHSAIRYWRGKGGTWKGRAQDVRGS